MDWVAIVAFLTLGRLGVSGDATPLGLLVIGCGTQGRPSCLRPTLGWGTQSRWDWRGSGKCEV